VAIYTSQFRVFTEELFGTMEMHVFIKFMGFIFMTALIIAIFLRI
jgi:hypothetical protein